MKRFKNPTDRMLAPQPRFRNPNEDFFNQLVIDKKKKSDVITYVVYYNNNKIAELVYDKPSIAKYLLLKPKEAHGIWIDTKYQFILPWLFNYVEKDLNIKFSKFFKEQIIKKNPSRNLKKNPTDQKLPYYVARGDRQKKNPKRNPYRTDKSLPINIQFEYGNLLGLIFYLTNSLTGRKHYYTNIENVNLTSSDIWSIILHNHDYFNSEICTPWSPVAKCLVDAGWGILAPISFNSVNNNNFVNGWKKAIHEYPGYTKSLSANRLNKFIMELKKEAFQFTQINI